MIRGKSLSQNQGQGVLKAQGKYNCQGHYQGQRVYKSSGKCQS